MRRYLSVCPCITETDMDDYVTLLTLVASRERNWGGGGDTKRMLPFSLHVYFFYATCVGFLQLKT